MQRVGPTFLKEQCMNEQTPDFDIDELNKVVREIIYPLENRFNEFERTHGSNFTASLAASLASELLLRLAITAKNVDEIQSAWHNVYQTSSKSLVNYAEYALFMKQAQSGLDKKQ